jgi:type II secretory pathway pseudopilin PulG
MFLRNCKRGFSLLDVIIVAGIMGGLLTVYLQTTQMQNRGSV